MANELFKKIAAAKENGSGDYFPPGIKGMATLVQAGIKTGFKGQSAIWRFRLDTVEAKRDGVNPPKPGVVCSFVQNMSKTGTAGDMALNNLLTCALRVAGVAKSEVTDSQLADFLEAAHGETQPLRGFRVAFDVVEKTTGKGQVINIVNFTSLKENSDEEVAKREKTLPPAEKF